MDDVAFNQQVAGSSPAGLTNQNNGLGEARAKAPTAFPTRYFYEHAPEHPRAKFFIYDRKLGSGFNQHIATTRDRDVAEKICFGLNYVGVL